jgi:DNA-binding winged helix-turn-helix (wHTH) protein/tetratricopeptide (TPR) repeat protein
MSVLRFGAFVLDPARGAVLRDGVEVELRTQSFAVLSHLASHPGRLVSKDELFDAIWSGVARTDDSLVQCITEIRKALGDADHRIIKTVRGKGYRFVAEVSPAPAAPQTAPEPDPSLPRDASPPAVRPQIKWQAPLIALGLLIAVLAGGGSWFLWDWAARPPELTMMAKPSIAVLPVKPLGDDTDAALGTLADEIVAGIWRAPRGFEPDIRPTSAIKDPSRDPRTLGRDLGARYIVRSLVRREDRDMHIHVELIEAQTLRQVWLGAFGYRLGASGGQNRAAAFIGRTLVAELLRAEVRRALPPKVEAGHYTMLGRALMTEESNADRNGQAIANFEKALKIAPENFLALVHYARAVATHGLSGWLPENEKDKLARAEDAIKRALLQQPKGAGAHVTHGSVLRAKGEHEQAIEAFRLALVHNPNFLPARAELGRALVDLGQPKQALAEIEAAIEMSPTDISRHVWCFWAGLAALHAADPERALEWLRKSHQANPENDTALRLMAVALADAGWEDQARQKMAEFLKLRPEATLDDWKTPNSRRYPEVAQRHEHIRATLKRLGLPEGKLQAAAKR